MENFTEKVEKPLPNLPEETNKSGVDSGVESVAVSTENLSKNPTENFVQDSSMIKISHEVGHQEKSPEIALKPAIMGSVYDNGAYSDSFDSASDDEPENLSPEEMYEFLFLRKPKPTPQIS